MPADKVIEIPGVGQVSFPESMSDDEISTAARKLYDQKIGGPSPSLLPQGTAPATPQVADASQTGLKDLFGVGSNVAGMGSAGAQLGSMFGPVGTAAGGVLGGALGAFLPPSETPGTDLGANIGESAASLLFRGAPKLVRAGAQLAGAGLGALAGGQGDKAMGFQKETPLGRVGLYTALSTPAAILSAMSGEASPALQAAERLSSNGYGDQIPLSAAESINRFRGLTNDLTRGSAGSVALGAQQDAAAQSALEKIIGAPLDKSLDVVLEGSQLGTKAKQIMNDWRRQWQAANPKIDVSEVPSGVLDANGNPLTKTVTTTSKNPVVNWDAFGQAMGLTREERNAFFEAIRKNPNTFVEQLLPGGENQVKGLLQLRALMNVFTNSGNTTEAGKLGTAVVMRYLRGPMELGEAANGTKLATRIENALGSATEPGHLAVALGPQRADALRDLATVLKDANPAEKVNAAGTSVTKRAAQYTLNKIVFGAGSLTAGALAGAQAPVGTFLLGTTGGAVAGIGLSAMIGGLMMKPTIGKLLIAAAKGDTSAGTRIFRTLSSSAMSASEREDNGGEGLGEFAPSSAASRLRDLFAK